MKGRYFARTVTLILSVFFLAQEMFAQTAEQKLTTTILYKDSLFWTAYNNCDTEKFGQFFTDDVEFYHDKGGITDGLKSLAESFKNNLCSNENFRLRREGIEGTMKVFPLHKSDTIYGAILSGEHVFYILEKGKKERLDGKARFTHLWLLNNGVWKMSRVLSYDHGPAPDINTRKEIQLSAKILNQFVGKYKGAQSGTLIIQKENDLLTFGSENKKSILYPEKQNLFFMKERDLTFEFIKNSGDKDYKLVVREHGEVVEELIKQK
jgi:hypothetical protein